VTATCKVSRERGDTALLPGETDSRGLRRVALFLYIADRQLGPKVLQIRVPFLFSFLFFTLRFRGVSRGQRAFMRFFYVSNRYNIIVYLIISTESRCYLYLYIIFIYII